MCVCGGGGGMCVCVCDVCRGRSAKKQGGRCLGCKGSAGGSRKNVLWREKKGEKIVKKGIVTVSALDKQKKRGVPYCLAKNIFFFKSDSSGVLNYHCIHSSAVLD